MLSNGCRLLGTSRSLPAEVPEARGKRSPQVHRSCRPKPRGGRQDGYGAQHRAQSASPRGLVVWERGDGRPPSISAVSLPTSYLGGRSTNRTRPRTRPSSGVLVCGRLEAHNNKWGYTHARVEARRPALRAAGHVGRPFIGAADSVRRSRERPGNGCYARNHARGTNASRRSAGRVIQSRPAGPCRRCRA